MKKEKTNLSKILSNDEFFKKIEKLYQNYGMDTSNMDEDELLRLKDLYQKRGRSIDADIAASEKYKDRFIDDLV